jgi:hypothetical protein
MKKATIILILSTAVIFSGFSSKPKYEQIAFDYFFSDIFNSEFKDVSTIEFEGVTMVKFPSFDKDAICFAGLQKLYPEMNSMFNTSFGKPVKISAEASNVKFAKLHRSSKEPKLYVSHKITMIDNIYLLMSVDRPGTSVVTYLFEMDQDGKVSSTCKTEQPQ